MSGKTWEFEDDNSLPLHGKICSAEMVVKTFEEQAPTGLHLCREDDGDVVILIGTSEAKLNQEEVRWLAGHLTGALDNWPQRG